MMDAGNQGSERMFKGTLDCICKIYKNEEEVKLENPDPKDIKRDVKIIIPKGFDVVGEEPLK